MKLLMILGLALLLVTVGCVSNAQNQNTGDIVQPDGTILKADGTMVKTDGTMIKPDGTMIKPDGTMVKPDGTMIKPDGTMIAPDGTIIEPNDEVMTKGVEYVPFTKEAYDQAKADGKTIFLEFYANWCPTCKAQAPALEEGFSMIQSENLVAFRVNYKDTETDADETALAQKFNITYQHTHVVTNTSEETLLKSNEEWTVQDVVEKIGVFA